MKKGANFVDIEQFKNAEKHSLQKSALIQPSTSPPKFLEIRGPGFAGISQAAEYEVSPLSYKNQYEGSRGAFLFHSSLQHTILPWRRIFNYSALFYEC